MKNYNIVANELALTVKKETRLTIVKESLEKAIILSSKVMFSTFMLIVLNLVF